MIKKQRKNGGLQAECLLLKSLEKEDVCTSTRNWKCMVAKIKHCAYVNFCTSVEMLGQFLITLNKL